MQLFWSVLSFTRSQCQILFERFHVKIRPLPEVDLANFTTLSLDDQRHRMKRMAEGEGGHFSFDPTRKNFSDILNCQPPLLTALGAPAETPFEQIERALVLKCKAGNELKFNLAV